MSRAQLTSTTQQDSGGAVAPFLAGKNKIINGDFSINQRSFSSTTSSGVYMFDRWKNSIGGDGTATFSTQAFTAGTAPVTGYESTNFIRVVTASQTNSSVNTLIVQSIEDVRTLAGQTATISFWARSGSGTPSIAVELQQGFGSGGSSDAFTTAGKLAITTSWARYSVTVAVPNLSGKTIGSSSSLGLNLWLSAGSNFNSRTSTLGVQNNTFDIWGVQVESGSVATPFTTASNTVQGELALCQRYFQVVNANALFNARSGNTTLTDGVTYLPVTMRTPPALAATAPLKIDQAGVANFTQSSASVSISGFADAQNVGMTAGNFTGLPSANVWLFLRNDGGKIWMSAEL
jgi:hypothetical protein